MRPAGYYHTNYDLLSWIRLGSQLLTKKVLADPLERAGVITDAFTAALAGKAEPWLPLFLLSEDLIDEYKAAPWQAAYSGLRAYAALVKADPDTERLFLVSSATTKAAGVVGPRDHSGPCSCCVRANGTAWLWHDEQTVWML